MDGNEIFKVVTKDQCLHDQFRGIFARDQVPRCLMPGFFVWNTDLYSGGGVHWVCAYVSDTHKVEFFDSFGQPLQFYGWNILKEVQYNEKPLQSSDSEVCGMYCLFYLYFRCRGLSMDSIIANFGENTRINDKYVLDFFHLLQ